MRTWAAYLIAGGLGGVVGVGELAARYRDSPSRSLLEPAAALYIVFNIAASCGALAIVRVFDWTFGAADGVQQDLLQAMIAGAGALALLRTKLFSASYQGGSYAWGPSRVLEQLLGVADRQVDRSQAEHRSRTVSEVMSDVSFGKAKATLPAYALGLLENVSEEEQKRLASDVKALIDDQAMSEEAKAQLLGLAVIRLTGPELLSTARTGLGATIAY